MFKISVTMRDTQPLPLGDIVLCHSEQGVIATPAMNLVGGTATF